MKIGQAIQTHFKSMGIEANRGSFGMYELKRVVMYIVMISSLCVCVAYVAETAREYVKSIFIITLTGFMLVCYSILKLNSKKIFQIIDGLEQIIDKST